MSDRAYGDDPGSIAQVLRSTPFHRWAMLRDGADEHGRAKFDEAVVRVSGEWSTNDQHVQIKEALAAAAAEIVLALPDWPRADEVLFEHLRNASSALDAAKELAARSRSAA